VQRIGLAALAAFLLCASVAFADDVIKLKNGKVFRGKIVKETEKEVVFEYRQRGIKAQVTFKKEEIAKITRDAPPEKKPPKKDPVPEKPPPAARDSITVGPWDFKVRSVECTMRTHYYHAGDKTRRDIRADRRKQLLVVEARCKRLRDFNAAEERAIRRSPSAKVIQEGRARSGRKMFLAAACFEITYIVEEKDEGTQFRSPCRLLALWQVQAPTPGRSSWRRRTADPKSEGKMAFPEGDTADVTLVFEFNSPVGGAPAIRALSPIVYFTPVPGGSGTGAARLAIRREKLDSVDYGSPRDMKKYAPGTFVKANVSGGVVELLDRFYWRGASAGPVTEKMVRSCRTNRDLRAWVLRVMRGSRLWAAYMKAPAGKEPRHVKLKLAVKRYPYMWWGSGGTVSLGRWVPAHVLVRTELRDLKPKSTAAYRSRDDFTEYMKPKYPPGEQYRKVEEFLIPRAVELIGLRAWLSTKRSRDPDEPFVDLLAWTACRHPDAEVRREAVKRMLGVEGKKKMTATEALLAALRDRDDGVRWEAAKKFASWDWGALGGERALSLLVDLLGGDPEARVRSRAAQTLRSICARNRKAGTPRVIGALTKALSDDDGFVRRGAVEAIEKIGPAAASAIPALTRALEDKDKSVRRRAARVLGSMKERTRSAIPKLVERLVDGREMYDVQNAVRYALTRIPGGTERAVTALTAALRSEDLATRKNAAKKLGVIGVKAAPALPALRAAMTDKSLKIEKAAKSAIWRIERDLREKKR